MRSRSKYPLDQIPHDHKNALELSELILRFVSLADIYPESACEIAADYLEYQLGRDEEEALRELAPHIAKFLRSQIGA